MILHQESSTVQLVTAEYIIIQSSNDNDIDNTEICHQESSKSTNSAAAYLPPMIMTITLTMTMTKSLTIITAQKFSVYSIC